MSQSVKDNLIAAKVLISDPAKWAKCAFEIHDCYCAVGAVEAVIDGHYRLAPNETDALCAALPHDLPDGVERHIDWSASSDRARLVYRFNDAPTTTHADIMALFDRAIEAQP